MSGNLGYDTSVRQRRGVAPFSELARKVLLLVGDDALALSHFLPLMRVLRQVARELVVVTRSSGRLGEIEALGARVIDFDVRRPAGNLLREAASAWNLASILEGESPDAVHLVGMKPVILGGLALKLVPARRVILHTTGLGMLGSGTDARLRLYRAGTLRLIGSMLRRPSSYLLVENASDLAMLREHGADPGPRFAILGGAGVDPDVFPMLPPPQNDVPTAAFVGRMTRGKGLDLLMAAYDRLKARGARVGLELHGAPDKSDLDCIASETLKEWCGRRGVRWPGQAADVREVWRHADIFVLPARSREGMPRALLEAAACGRPLIVTDVPGCSHFVRDGTEGLVVPPGDADALAEALQRLASDPELRGRMGEAARLRLLQGYTEAHVQETLRATYRSMFAGERALH